MSLSKLIPLFSGYLLLFKQAVQPSARFFERTQSLLVGGRYARSRSIAILSFISTNRRRFGQCRSNSSYNYPLILVVSPQLASLGRNVVLHGQPCPIHFASANLSGPIPNLLQKSFHVNLLPLHLYNPRML